MFLCGYIRFPAIYFVSILLVDSISNSHTVDINAVALSIQSVCQVWKVSWKDIDDNNKTSLYCVLEALNY